MLLELLGGGLLSELLDLEEHASAPDQDEPVGGARAAQVDPAPIRRTNEPGIQPGVPQAPGAHVQVEKFPDGARDVAFAPREFVNGEWLLGVP